jgi:histidinol-phosphate/aromatic aminotransferase/cobyric acid decarboxylase-like protein
VSESTSERVHGGLDPEELARFGVAPSGIVDFSVNVNPYGPCAPVVEAARSAALDVYPDPHGRLARARWAERLQVSSASVCVGHGASDLFWAIVLARVRPGDKVVIAEPTFSELAVAARAAHAQVQSVVADALSGFRHDLDALARGAHDARILYLCSPNNPTGVYLPVDAVAQLSRALPATWIVLDQSFLSLSDHAGDELCELPANVIRVRSLTKDYALPGLRIGLAVGDPASIRRIEAARPTWPTSAPALSAIAAAALERTFVAQSYLRMRADRDEVRRLLMNHGYAVQVPSSTYCLAQVGAASAFRARMLRHGVNVRDCTSFGLPGYVRVAALPTNERRVLGAALHAMTAP